MSSQTPRTRRSPARLKSRLDTWWEQLGFGTERHARRVLTLSLFGLVSGLGEAAVVVLVIGLASGGSAGTLPLLGEAPPSTGVLACLALASLAALAAAHFGSARATAHFAAEAERTIQQMLVSAYLRAPWPAQSAAPAGQLQDLVLRKAALIAHGTQQAATAMAAALNLVVVVVAALLVSPWATLVLGAALAVVVVLAVPFRGRVRTVADSTVEASAAMAADVTEKAGMARDLRIFGVTDRALDDLRRQIAATASLHRRMRLYAMATPRLTRDASLAVLVMGITIVVATSDIGLSTLGIAAVLVFRALAHAQAIAAVSQVMVQRRANLEHVRDRLHAWHSSGATGSTPCVAVQRLRLTDVGHVYADGSPPALDGIDLTISRGEMVGLVGASGAGKTTLASVLLGLVQPSHGIVHVDDVPLEELDPADWHAHTAWVAQEPHLLSGTIAHNVRFLRPWIDDERVRSALEVAGLRAEVDAWRDGIHEEVGPGGIRLSGGERQRVALARAVAGDPDLIVLDEPTSGLDPQTEAAVRGALDELREAAAVVIIAHRLSTIRSCDRVAVLEKGRIVAIAPPAELEHSSVWFKRALELSRAT